MPDSVLIVCLPSNPLRFDDLRPCTHAAALSAHFNEAGLASQILDFATVESYERLVGPGSPVWRMRRSKRRRGRVVEPVTPIDLGFPDELAHASDWMYSRLRRKRAHVCPTAIVFIARDPFGWKVAGLLHDRVHAESKADAPDVAMMDVGSGAPRMWLRKGPDWLGSLEMDAFAAHWTCFAGMKSGRSRATGYHPTRYAALEDETKLRVFDIGDDADPAQDAFGVTRAIEECNVLYRDHRSRAFQFHRSIADVSLDRLAQELANRRLGFVYCVHAGMRARYASLASALSASGCVAARVRVPSGSQRLLDIVFKSDYGISEAVSFVRAAARSGMHTGVTVSYPIAEDDYHTADETIRFLRRAAPHVAEVELPGYLRKAPAGVVKRATRDRDVMQKSLSDFGMGGAVTPWQALVASLAGYAGRERQFLAHADFLLCSGDIVALGEIIEGINRNAYRGIVGRYTFGDEEGERVVGN